MSYLPALLALFCLLPPMSFWTIYLVLGSQSAKNFCRYYFGLPAVCCISLLGASASYNRLQTMKAEEYIRFVEICAEAGGVAYWKGTAAEERVCLQSAREIKIGDR